MESRIALKIDYGSPGGRVFPIEGSIAGTADRVGLLEWMAMYNESRRRIQALTGKTPEQFAEDAALLFEPA
jgi:hypothetical protein